MGAKKKQNVMIYEKIFTNDGGVGARKRWEGLRFVGFFALGFGEKAAVLDDDPFVDTLSDGACLILCRDMEDQFALVHLGEFCLTGNGHADGGGAEVPDIHVCADGRTVLGKETGHGHPCGLFQFGDEDGGGQDGQGAASDRFGGKFRDDGECDFQ